MSKTFLSVSLWMLLFWAGLAGAAPVVSNIVATQRVGTKLVDVTYDVAGAGMSAVAVSLEISSDGGATFAVPATTVTGAIGAGVAVGTGKVLTWNAGADWAGQYSAQVRFRITADDGVANPVPVGLVLIPGGTFQMGDGLLYAPVHSVTLSAFYLQSKETTIDEWNTVKTWALANGYTITSAGAGKAPGHPVHTVNWYDVVKWCNARSVMENLVPCYYTDAAQTTVYRSGSEDVSNAMVKWSANGYRLPTEAEWEYAARGGLSGKRFPWGDTVTHSLANYYSSATYAYDISPTRGYHPTYSHNGSTYTSPVGAFTANGYGLYDMAGNVSEWCWDWHGFYYYGDPTANNNPHGPDTGSYRLLRGGAWGFNTFSLSCANRANDEPRRTFDFFGFRCARGL